MNIALYLRYSSQNQTEASIEGQREKVILEILYGSGIRVSELVNIKIKDIDFSNKTILIFGKGSKERIVPFGDYALDAINMYMDEGAKPASPDGLL